MIQDIWATRPAHLDEETAARSPLLDAKVMMVDDEPLMTELIQTHLEDAGYTNFVATHSPHRAVERVRRERPGVVLLDLVMPGMSGFEVLAALRRDSELRYTPVIVLTATAHAEAKLQALQLGATDFLAKPVDPSELALRVRNTLAFQQYHERAVNFDSGTGLPNHRLFDRAVELMVARRALTGGMVTLLSLRVPQWRTLRETVGSASAEALMTALGRRLARLVLLQPTVAHATPAEQAPRVARLGTDRFGLVFEAVPDAAAAERLAREAVAAVSAPLMVGAHEIVPTAWIGISVAPADGDTVEALRKGADLASSHAEQFGGAHYKFASRALHTHTYERLMLGSQLRGAASRGELRLHYQPKVEFAQRRIVGAEALVRWQHPLHGLLPPGRFVPLAEEVGLVADVGEWVLTKACMDFAKLDPTHALTLSVNVARPQFNDTLCDLVAHALRASGLAARQLVLEITESMLMDDAAQALVVMHRLKQLGVALSIDDFGTGYSSLSYLKRFPVSELKIDRSFVQDLPEGRHDEAIVQTVTDLAHRLGMHVIAEGVETAAQEACLKRVGCDAFQGFYFSKPVEYDVLLALVLRQDTGHPSTLSHLDELASPQA